MVGAVLLPCTPVRHDHALEVRAPEERVPEARAIEAATALKADVVELHTGSACERMQCGDASGAARELERLRTAAARAGAAGLEVHAGHGLTFASVAAVARIPEIVELNIGHFLVGEAIFGGLNSAVRRMRMLMDAARTEFSSRSVA